MVIDVVAGILGVDVVIDGVVVVVLLHLGVHAIVVVLGFNVIVGAVVVGVVVLLHLGVYAVVVAIVVVLGVVVVVVVDVVDAVVVQHWMMNFLFRRNKKIGIGSSRISSPKQFSVSTESS